MDGSASPEALNKDTGIEEEAMESIRKAAEGLTATFCCGGRSVCSQTIKLYFHEQGNEKHKGYLLELPEDGADEVKLQKLIQGCSQATFGKGKEDVLDPTYRKALKLEPQQFVCNINLAELGILEEISKLMAADKGSIRAELYKLNVHKKGDFFKAHVDTPRNEDMVASLVLVLPCIHEGGAVLVEHNGASHTFETSLPKLPGAPEVQWMAFYSDCQHEVQEVTSGVRLTLTSNLFTLPSHTPFKAIQPESLAIYDVLLKALQNPRFLPEGGKLAFGCQHAYAHNSDGTSSRSLEGRLKGADASLLAVARACGLQASVQPVELPEKYGTSRRIKFTGSFGIGFDDYSREEDYNSSDDGSDDEEESESVHWCHDLVHSDLSYIKLAYGNDYSNEAQYNYAALVMTVPGYDERSGCVNKLAKKRKVDEAE